jgi:uncharacterized membrane protein YhhN
MARLVVDAGGKSTVACQRREFVMRTILLAAAACCAVAYVLTLPLQPYPYSVAAKTLPCLCLAGACAVSLSGLSRWLMVTAMLLSAVADAAITVAFELGLAVFLVVQLTYCALFLRRRRPPGDKAWLKGLILVFYGIALAVLLPRAGGIAPAVGVYITAITMMVITAVSYRGSVLVAAGAISFMASDTVIGVDRFWLPFEAAGLVIMSSYYAGQFMIALGVIRSEGLDGRSRLAAG